MRPDVISTDPFVREVQAQALRLGKQLLTPDGWQTIRGLLVFADADQVTVFTDEQDDLWTDGWRFHLADPVQARLQPTAEQEYQQKRKERQERRRLRRLAMAAAGCPPWCVEHYDGTTEGQEKRNHSSEPESVIAANAWSGDPVELGFWLERRDDHDNSEAGTTATFGILEAKTLDDIELTPDVMRQLAGRLMSLADRAILHR
jgi:hypothetical protein